LQQALDLCSQRTVWSRVSLASELTVVSCDLGLVIVLALLSVESNKVSCGSGGKKISLAFWGPILVTL